MDLLLNHTANLSLQWTDDDGNVVDTPEDVTGSYATNDPTVLTLVDHGDGTATITGLKVGPATVTGTFTSGGQQFLGELHVDVFSTVASRINIISDSTMI